MPLDPNCWLIAAKLAGTPPPSTPYDVIFFIAVMITLLGMAGLVVLIDNLCNN